MQGKYFGNSSTIGDFAETCLAYKIGNDQVKIIGAYCQGAQINNTPPTSTHCLIQFASTGQIISYYNYVAPTKINNTIKMGSGSDQPIFAPTTAGTSGQLLKSSGSGAPTWFTPNYATTSSIPSRVSQLTNDAGFITASDIPDTDFTGLATEEQLETKLDKVTTTYGEAVHRIYAIGTTGEQYIIRTTDNTSNEITTKSYVDTKISTLIDSAPDTLNTLNELATAIQENDTVIDTLNTAIGNKANQTSLDATNTNVTNLQTEMTNVKTSLDSKLGPESVDAELSDTSTNPIQNKILYGYFTHLGVAFSQTQEEVETLKTSKADASTIPTKTSDLTNDSGFITETNSDGKYVPLQLASSKFVVGSEGALGDSWVGDGTSSIGILEYTSDETTGNTSQTGLYIEKDLANLIDYHSVDGSVYSEQIMLHAGNILFDISMQGEDQTLAQQLVLNAETGLTLNGNKIITEDMLPTKVSELENDSGFITSYTETDPTVPSWAKASTKPTYSYSEITDKPTLFSGSYTDLTNQPTKKYLHRLKYSVVSADKKNSANLTLDYYSTQATAYTGVTDISIAYATPHACSGFYTDGNTDLTAKLSCWSVAIAYASSQWSFIFNGNEFSTTIDLDYSTVTDEIIGYVLVD